jgi:hypothetical protein
VKKYNRSGQATGDTIIQHMRISRWVPKATYIHLEYVTLIVLPLQQWLHESASMLRTYIIHTLPVLLFLSWFLLLVQFLIIFTSYLVQIFVDMSYLLIAWIVL